MKINGFQPRKWALGALVLALAVALAYVALRTGPLAPVQVQTVAVASGRVQPDLFGIGQVEARRSWMVGPTATARVRSVAVDVGQAVAPGHPLAELEPVDLDQRLAALDASLNRAHSARAAAQAQAVDAQARRVLAQNNLQRNQDLANQQFISPGALDARRQELASADAAWQVAQANASASEQDLARLQAERLGLAQQRATLRLVAPAAAVVSTREAEAGSTVLAGQPVLRLIDPSSLWVRMRVDQGRSDGLAVGLKAQVTLRSRPGAPVAGRVERIEPLADPVTEERLAMVSVSEWPAGVSVGEMAEVTLTLNPSAPGLVLPNAALQVWQGRTGVWRVQADALAFVPLQVGPQGLDGRVLVTPADGASLSEGDTVVHYSQTALKPDTRIRLVSSVWQPGAAK